ncbi:MAG: sn-glycerol-3-phosphate ABC transporter ATP-binding protein UgpC [Lachnospiraceae bacterium]|nr:sn-glycerol-3-phosphate ABC transporter ATP-binding protein UgpC [Lachnospiraceae bacterium]
MSTLTLRNICKIYQNDNYAVKDFNLEISDQEFIIFVGPSGCGKSTTLRMIAGLEEISGGELWIDGELSNYLEPKERNLSMVFQNYALYPNMTVYDNMAFALKVRKMPKKQIDEKVREAARILEIEHLLERYPKALSGGQKQRVAIGSAIVRNPKLFLMDEPLSNLDAKLRAQMRVELSKLHKELGTTMIYVTHDQTEAMTLGTRIVVMKAGEVSQVDSPQVLYQHPVNKFVAGFIGSPSMNFLDVSLYRGYDVENQKTYLTIEDHPVYLLEKTARLLKEKGYHRSKVTFGIRPEDIYTEEGKEANPKLEYSEAMQVTIIARELLGAEVMLYFDLEGIQFCARVEPENQTQVGEKLKVYFDLNRIHLFDMETEQTLNL